MKKNSGVAIILFSLCTHGVVGKDKTDEDEAVSYFRCHGGLAQENDQPYPESFDPEKGLVWKQALDPGNSTPCVHGGLIYATTHFDKELATVALYRDSGRVRWKRVVPVSEIEPYHRTGSPASCTPACEGERLYVFFGSYGLLCYDLDGQLLWSRRLGPFQDEFGANSSPVLVDGKVILSQDHDIDSFLIAFDQETGETLWKVPREGFTRSYSTPVVWNVDGRKQLVVAGSRQLIAYDLRDGNKRWWVNGMARFVNPTPAVAANMLFATGWSPGGDAGSRISMEPWPEAEKLWDKDRDGKITRSELPEGPVLQRFFRIDLNQDKGLDEEEWKKHARVFDLSQNALLAIRPGGSGNVSGSHVVWKYLRGLPTVPSPLVYRGVVYLVKDGGIVTSLDARSGKVLKQGRARGLGNYYASPVAGDGKIYLGSERGVVTVLRAKEEWEIISSRDFGERIMATPVLRDGRVYLRTDRALYSFGAEPVP